MIKIEEIARELKQRKMLAGEPIDRTDLIEAMTEAVKEERVLLLKVLDDLNATERALSETETELAARDGITIDWNGAEARAKARIARHRK